MEDLLFAHLKVSSLVSMAVISRPYMDKDGRDTSTSLWFAHIEDKRLQLRIEEVRILKLQPATANCCDCG
jgi:hypothetical protein